MALTVIPDMALWEPWQWGEGGGELVKQLLSQTYDINMPGVVAIYLKGEPRPGSWSLRTLRWLLSEKFLQMVM